MSDVSAIVAATPLETIVKRTLDGLVIPYDYDGPQQAHFRAHLHAKFRLSLEHGDFTIRDDDFFLRQLRLYWDQFELGFDIDIPTVTVGGFCIIPTPFGCILHAPKITIFDGNPDISVTLPINDLVRSEISIWAKLKLEYWKNPDRLSTMGDYDAFKNNVLNQWQLKIRDPLIHLDLFNLSATVGDLLEKIVDAAIDTFLGFLPDWAKDAIKFILGSIIALIRLLLEIPEDIVVWMTNRIGYALNLFDFLVSRLGGILAENHPLVTFDDPLKIMDETPNPNDATKTLIPVFLALRNAQATINHQKVIVSTDIGP